MPPSSDDEIPLNGRGPHAFDLSRTESRRRATFGRVAGGTSTNEPQPRPEIIPIQRGPEPSGPGPSPPSSSTATATATASSATTSSASNHEKSFKEQQRRRLLYLQETRQQNQQNQPQQKWQTQTLGTGTHPLSKSFTANAKDREVHCLDTPPPPSSHISSLAGPSETAQSAASILQQQVQGEHQQSQRSQQQSQQSQQQQSQQEHQQQESRQSQQPQQEQQHQDDNEIAIREESLELLESLTSISTSNDMNRGSGGGGGAFGQNDRDNINNSNNSNKRRAEIDLERPTARRLSTGNITPGHMSGSGHISGSGHMSGSIFGQPGSGVGPYSPVPGASAPQMPTHPASFDLREGPGVGGGDGGGQGAYPPFSRGASPMPQVPFAQPQVPFAQPRTPGAVTMTGAAPQRGQRGERAGSVASVTSITSRNGPPMVNPSLPNLPPDGTNWLTGRIVVVSVGAERRKWNVHEQLLSYNSPYFKRLFNPEPEPVEGSSSSPGDNDHHHHQNPATGAADGREPVLSEPIEEVHLPTTEPKLFALLIRWLYGTAFATSGGQKVFKFPPPQLNQVTVRDYLGLYILGQTVQLPGLRNACIDVLYNYYAAETEEVRVPDLHDVQYIFENTAHAPDSQMRRLLVAHCMFHLYGVKRRGPLPPDWQEVMEPRCNVAYEMFKMLADWKWVIGENVPTMKIKARHAFHEKPRPEELLPWHKAQTQEEAGMPLVGVVKAEPVDE
ncbi:hypothetical protein B0H65DRAFT_558298 [Neurospora tetraspora]|uniref:BTB domain-containing protein n=1 Tax=Neurospora tetraspora TaxID=94610 RepID=A0AAE0MRT7_9PEZI|nr:hypothetical protein B0H65DRAFT_558298 [Neurospora tetraspora]